ncbi:MAG: hypothetical protein EBZ77_18120, partial [Chitinophagia bacterium]|nr:hypothetical protein [Chitinophagia bacterium]
NPSTGLAYSSPPAKLPFASARAQAQAENLKAFYIYNGATLLSGKNAQPANFTALDLSQNRAADQILAAFSAVVMTAGQNGNGVNTLLSQIEADFADDGILNNSPKYPQSVSSRLCAAAAGTNFAAVAANLNNFYGTKYQPTDLSQWVDTSGCVDQVIDKYKFSASNVAVGTVSKSPAYIVGPDDVGQCFSVGGVTGGGTASLYYNGATNPVASTQLAKLGDRMELGLSVPSAMGTSSAFIQRSAPLAYGTCPNSVPTVGLTTVQRFTAYGTSASGNEGQTLNNFINLLRSGFRQSSRLMDDRITNLKSRADKLLMDNVGDGLSVINKYLNDCSYISGSL